MRRFLLVCGGILLGLLALTILWNAPALYLFTDSWHAAGFTRMVGLGIIVEGALAALGAALCLGRAVVPLAPEPTQGVSAALRYHQPSASGGPVLPLCGIIFLLAATGPFGQGRHDSEALEVMESMPGQWGDDLVDDFRKHEHKERTFGVLWLVVGGALLVTPLLLKPRVWQMGRRMNRIGYGIATGGLLLSGVGALVCFANGLLMEGANKDLAYAGYLGVLAGAIAALIGSMIAAVKSSRA